MGLSAYKYDYCKIHGKTEFVPIGAKTSKYYGNSWSCYKCRRNKTKEIYQKIKSILIKPFGSKCQRCGYNESTASLDFHHINPEDKTMIFKSLSYKRLPELIDESKKCALLCRNCHGAFHSDDIEIDFNRMGYYE